MSQQLVEEILQHAGIKGMKWGIRKKIQKAGRGLGRKLSANRKAKIEKQHKYHEKNKNKKSYSRKYNLNLKLSKGNHNKAVALTVSQARSSRNTKIILATIVAAKAAKIVASRPESVRMGKNIVQAFKGSPLRYVNGSKFKNVIDL